MTYGEKMKEFVETHSPLYKIYEYVTTTEAVVVAWGGREVFLKILIGVWPTPP